MKRFNEYKDSGIDWIGEIPKHWNLVPLKFAGKIQNGSTPSSSEDAYWNGEINWVTTDDLGKLEDKYITASKRKITQAGFDSCGTQMAPVGSIVISTRAPIGHIGILRIEACTNQGCKTIIPENIMPEYCFYALKISKSKLESLGEGSTFKELPTSRLKSFKLPAPPVSEQIKIGAYLDYKTSQIDKLICDKEKLIELLNEERSAIINQAVTKGIDPLVPMKDSGVDSLSEIPQHWQIKKLKYCFKIIGGFAFKSEDFCEQGIQLIKIGNLYQNKLQLDRQPSFVPESFKLSCKEFLAKKGDILMSLTGTLGKRDYGFAILIEDDYELLVNQRVAKIQALENMNVEFSIHLFQSETYLNNLYSIPTGTKQGNLSTEDVLSIKMAIPPVHDQLKISSFVKKENQKFSRLVDKLETEIELLKEYKIAFISEVVTGKVDVRNEAIPETGTLSLAS